MKGFLFRFQKEDLENDILGTIVASARAIVSSGEYRKPAVSGH
jgi:hypothetical protein